MTREERKDAIGNLNMIRVTFIDTVTPEQGKLIDDTFRAAIEALREEKPETVTEFADRCRECGARYGKLLKQELCEDTISRQAVLAIVDSYSESHSNVEDVTQDIISYVVALPPVNPQPYEGAISREDALMCLTGEWTEITDEIIHRFIKRIKALPPVNPQTKTEWIPVSERLPEENKTVIASTDYCIYPEARYTEKCGWEGAYESGADYWVKIKDVIAWMSLPKHYEPQESEDKE